MGCPSPESRLFGAAVLVNRLALGMYFLLAGVAKVRGGITEFVDGTFTAMTPAWLPTAAARPYGYALPIIEIAAGAMLIVGFKGRLASGLMVLMLASFTLAAGIGAEHGPFSTNLILLTLALMLTVTGAAKFSIDDVTCKSCKTGACDLK